MKKNTRRHFVRQSVFAMGSLPLLQPWRSAIDFLHPEKPLPVHLFSKHLQFLDYRQAAEKTAEIRFTGLDLTVRPKGHVLPENVSEDLPKAINEIKKGGTSCQLITTAVDNPNDPLDVEVLKTAAGQGVTHYRSNWLKYDEAKTLPDSLKKHAQTIKALGILNKSLGLVGCYQNHAGTWVGASLWEVMGLLEQADTDYFGAQYDIRHATVEGGLSWENGLRLIKDSIKTIAVKDFLWKKENGQWRVVNVPIGEGMVDFKKYFGLIKKYGIDVPVILHAEYDLGGAERGEREISIAPKKVFDALKKDLNTVQRLWGEA